jgi:hypothetical protein
MPPQFRISILILLLVSLTFQSRILAQSDSARISMKVLPDKHIVPLFTADSRAHRISLQKPFNDNGFIFSMGGIFPLLNLSYKKRSVQLSGASSIYSTLRRWTNRGLVVNVDFFADLYVDIEITKRWAIRTGYGHTSHHLSDDALLDGLTPINYVRDYSQFFIVHKTKSGLAYAGLYYNDNFKTTTNQSPSIIYEIGFEQTVLKWYDYNGLFVAADVKFRGELNYRTSQNYQFGYKYHIPEKRAFRLVLSHSRGMEDRGQFFNQTRSFVAFGLFLDY